MIDTVTAIQYMYASLVSISPGYHPSIKKEFSTRCPWCGDSKKNNRSEHLYIKMTPDDRDNVAYFPYRCMLCKKTARFMSVQDAETIGINNSDLLEYIGKMKEKSKNSIKVSGANFIIDKPNFVIPSDIHVTSPKVIEEKKAYMYKRLQCQDILDHPENYRIIYDLKAFFMINKIKPNLEYFDGDIQRLKARLNYFNDHCVCFMSFDNSHINCRSIEPHPEQRYSQYVLYPSFVLKQKGASETSGIYMLPNHINIMAPQLKIVMTEGSFDILRVYTDFYKNKNTKNIIFASVSNSHGYAPCLTRFLEYGVMFNEIEIYSDNDIKMQDYKSLIKPLVPDATIRIYYNLASKDVGDKQLPVDLKSYYI